MARWHRLTPLVSATLAVGVLLACRNAPEHPVAEGAFALPFIENDYEKALAQAKAAARPLFVEVWAPW